MTGPPRGTAPAEADADTETWAPTTHSENSPVLSSENVGSLVDGIRSSFERAWEHYTDGCRQLVAAYQGKAWLALGLSDWPSFVAHTLDVDHLRIPKADRRQIVMALSEGGLSVRAVAAATGLGVGTVHRELNPGVPNGTADDPEFDEEDPWHQTMGKLLVTLGEALDHLDDIDDPGQRLVQLREIIEMASWAQNHAAERHLRLARICGRLIVGIVADNAEETEVLLFDPQSQPDRLGVS
jgi:hypothetical protein